MKPGKELDALVAEKVMGIKLASNESLWFKNPTMIKPYSTDIEAAWELVGQIFGIHELQFQVDGMPTRWTAMFYHHYFKEKNFRETCDTAPHAICLAALKAVNAL